MITIDLSHVPAHVTRIFTHSREQFDEPRAKSVIYVDSVSDTGATSCTRIAWPDQPLTNLIEVVALEGAAMAALIAAGVELGWRDTTGRRSAAEEEAARTRAYNLLHANENRRA